MRWILIFYRGLWASNQRGFARGLRRWSNECNRLFLQSWQQGWTSSNRSQWKILAVPFLQTILTDINGNNKHTHSFDTCIRRSFIFWHIDGKNILFLFAHPHGCVRVYVCVYKLNSFQSANKLQWWFHRRMFLNKLNWIKLNVKIKNWK